MLPQRLMRRVLRLARTSVPMSAARHSVRRAFASDATAAAAPKPTAPLTCAQHGHSACACTPVTAPLPGPVEVRLVVAAASSSGSGSGSGVAKVKASFVCVCGQSRKYPFCDGAHNAHNKAHGTAFKPYKVDGASKPADADSVWVCGCGHSAYRRKGEAPFCDGTHNHLKPVATPPNARASTAAL